MASQSAAVIGSPSNFWLHSEANGFDLTHPPQPDGPKTFPRLPLETRNARVTICPNKTALVIVDMQNFFLSPALGRSPHGAGIKACDQLLRFAIPACRKAGIRIVWLNWGLTAEDIENMPPATIRAFGFEPGSHDRELLERKKHGGEKSYDLKRGLGSQIGTVKLSDGAIVDAGRFLMRDQWNTALYEPLAKVFNEGSKSLSGQLDDVWIHKNRISGLWGASTDATGYFEAQGIKTLLWAGVNTDQCVGGSLQDAYTKGYDCFLLSDGCGTTSPDYALQCVEFNTAKVYGFVLSCEDLANGVEKIESE